ncbi:hypothetical protein FN846DRAFT_908166 [Sphaerosporella brunnea]|uniref:Uncharacterized protein n=1 Tax=Sphaerosporella brunnea TaxID=1250544 RepID=A0A5J5EUC8_9PEZI|nr:hypothetical protein FN846DRAFT_908166 [Sphaerosporella brunnea]
MNPPDTPLHLVWSYVSSLESLPENNLRFSLSPTDYIEFLCRLDGQVPPGVPRANGHICNSLRHDYDDILQLLTIVAMPSILHDTFGEFLHSVVAQMENCGFLSKGERHLFHVRIGSDLPLPADPLAKPHLRKPAVYIKQPDACIVPRGAIFPSLVVEVNQHTVGPKEQGTEALPAYPHNLSPEHYKWIHQNLNFDDWVNPIAAFLEEFRYEPDGHRMVQPGPEWFHLISDPNKAAHPDEAGLDSEDVVLRITDLLPSIRESCRPTFALPLKEYVKELEEARRHLAITRYIRYIRDNQESPRPTHPGGIMPTPATPKGKAPPGATIPTSRAVAAYRPLPRKVVDPVGVDDRVYD